MAHVDGVRELRSMYKIDVNQVICRAQKNQRQETTVTLCTRSNAWTKCLTITGGALIGKELKCGDKFGSKCQPPNDHLKSSSINLGKTNDPIYIKFEKSKTLGKLSNYGTIELPGDEVSGLDIVFFWPNDSEGDHWEHFKKVLAEVKTVSSELKSVQENVIVSGEAAAKLMGSVISLGAVV